MAADNSFDLESFRSSIQTDYHRASHFHFMTGVPKGLSTSKTNFNETSKKLMFEVESTNMPGIQIATDEVRRYGIGNFERKPYVPIFNTVQLIVRSDAEGQIYDFWQSWMKLIINFDVRNSIDRSIGFNSAAGYEVAYKEDYAVESSITSYSEGGDEVTQLFLKNSYPILINDTQYDWNNPNGLVKLQVTLTFSDWYQKKSIGTKSGSVKITQVGPTPQSK